MPAEYPFTVSPDHRPALLSLGLATLEGCMAFQGAATVKAAVDGRETLRFEANDQAYFMKRIRGHGRRDIVNEAQVLEHLRRAGLPVPELVAFGASERNGALVTCELPATRTLEKILVEENPDSERQDRIARRLAEMVGRVHDAGVNHRDLYVVHVLADDDDNLFLLDLGRAESRSRVPLRRVVKDLAALHFSIPSRGEYDGLRAKFLEHYAEATGRSDRLERLAHAVERKAGRIRHHVERKLARGDANIHVNE